MIVSLGPLTPYPLDFPSITPPLLVCEFRGIGWEVGQGLVNVFKFSDFG